MSSTGSKMHAAINKLAKWRSVFAGWQLGTRSKDDSESNAVRDHREVTLLLRAEVSAIESLLLEKKVCTVAELQAAITTEAEALDKTLESKFPGFRSSNEGMVIDVQVAAETTKGWRA